MQSILCVNLSTKKFSEYSIPRDWERDYLGGASLAARILFDVFTPELDPLSETAPLLFLNGPLSGTSGPAVGRFVVCGKSPATGLWAESNCGGFWGPELRKAGFYGIWVTGKAEAPVYLWVNDGEYGLKDAGEVWGLGTYQTQEALEKHQGKGTWRVASIGPAGEAQIPFALIHCDHGRVAGRTGMGAVMGAKNLKAIAVKGSGEVPVFRPDIYAEYRKEANRELRVDNQSNTLRELGSAAASDYFDYLGTMPKKYFSQGVFDDVQEVTGATIAETIFKKPSACHACVIACGRVVTLSDSKERKGPEYETIVGFGPNLLISDREAVTMLGEKCDTYGLDSISMSNIIGLAFQMFQRGNLTDADTGGVKLEWGNANAAEACIEMTVKREGLGQFLALGAKGLGDAFGVGEEAVQVNGLEVAYHDPRGASGMALVYATSPRGACHNQSDYFLVEIGQVEEAIGLEFFDRHAGAEKAGNVARHQNWVTLSNALVLCRFANVPPETVLKLTNAAMGLSLTLDELIQAGERGWNLKRMINHRLGLTGANDKLPKALLIAYEDGGAEGFVPDLPGMLAAYYQARGWHVITGMPTEEKLDELGLNWTIL